MRQSEFTANNQLSEATLRTMRRATAYQRLARAGYTVGRGFALPAPARAKPLPLQSSVDACGRGLLCLAGLAFALSGFLAFVL